MAEDFNKQVIDEFRANGGVVGGYFEGKPMLLLHTIGAKSGLERVTPLVYVVDDGDMGIIASKGGSPDNPAWYYNLKANPETTIEIGAETKPVTAVEVYDDERSRFYASMVADMPGFADYEKAAAGHRTIPVFRLDPR